MWELGGGLEGDVAGVSGRREVGETCKSHSWVFFALDSHHLMDDDGALLMNLCKICEDVSVDALTHAQFGHATGRGDK